MNVHLESVLTKVWGFRISYLYSISVFYLFSLSVTLVSCLDMQFVGQFQLVFQLH